MPTKQQLFKWVLLVFVIFFAFSCSQVPEKYYRGEKLLNQDIKKVIQKLNKKYKISLSAIGGGTDDEGIWLVMLMFSRRGKSYTVGEGRSIIIDCVQDLLNQINEDEAIRPYLKVFPLTPFNIDFTIISYKPDGMRMVDPDFEVVSCTRGEVEYTTLDPEDTYKYKTSIYETYDEALHILKKTDLEKASFKE